MQSNSPSFFLTGRERELKIILGKGGEVHEMDVPPCNPLLHLWFVAMVLSKTLNGSSEDKKTIQNCLGILKAGRGSPAFFFIRGFTQEVFRN